MYLNIVFLSKLPYHFFMQFTGKMFIIKVGSVHGERQEEHMS